MLINRWTIFEFPLYFAESKKKKNGRKKKKEVKVYIDVKIVSRNREVGEDD